MDDFYIMVSKGLLDPKHAKLLNSPALGLFLLLIDRTTKEKDGVGLVLGGAPLSYKDIVAVLLTPMRSLIRYKGLLEEWGYIKTQRTNRYGMLKWFVMKSKKFSKRKRGDVMTNLAEHGAAKRGDVMPQTATTTAKLAYPIREDREKTVKTRSRVEQVGDSVASTLLVSKTLATTPKPEVKPVAPAGSLAISGNSKSGVKLSPAAKGELIISAPDPKEIAKSRLKGFAPAIQELYAYVHRAHGPQALPKEGVWTFTKALEDEEHLERVWNWVWTNRNRPFWRDYLSKPDKEQYIFANFAQRASQIARQYGEDTRGTRNYPKIA